MGQVAHSYWSPDPSFGSMGISGASLTAGSEERDDVRRERSRQLAPLPDLRACGTVASSVVSSSRRSASVSPSPHPHSKTASSERQAESVPTSTTRSPHSSQTSTALLE